MIKKDKLPNFGYKTQQFGKHSIDSQCSTTTEPTQTDSSSPVEDTDTYNKDQKPNPKILVVSKPINLANATWMKVLQPMSSSQLTL